MRFIDAAEVREKLTYEVAIPAVRRAAMIALSAGETRQLLRSIMHFEDGRMFGVMPGAMGDTAMFGAKVLSVFPRNIDVGRPSHQGAILTFDPVTGELACVADGAARSPPSAHRGRRASAARHRRACPAPTPAAWPCWATARQAETHLRAIGKVRDLKAVSGHQGRSAGARPSLRPGQGQAAGLALRCGSRE